MSVPKNGCPALTTNKPCWRVALVCATLAAITLVTFLRTARYGFVVGNDEVYVYENPVVQGGLSWDGVVWTFTHAQCDLYHPLTMVSLMADYQAHGLNAGGYHVTNILLHAGAVLLLFMVLQQMTGALWRSAFMAAVFAIHPLRVESVVWVAERKDVLGAFFCMLTLAAYLRYVRLAGQQGSRARYEMVAVCFALALLSRPTAVPLPFVLLLLDFWPLRRFEKSAPLRLIVEKIPLLILAAAACALTMWAVKGWMVQVTHASLPLRVGNALISYAVYLKQMAWPTDLAVLYPFPRDGLEPWKVAMAAVLLAAISAVAWTQRRRRPWLPVGWLWYLGMLTPMLGLVKVGAFSHADRHTYLAQIGICVVVTWEAAEWIVKWRVPRFVTGVLMAAVVTALMVCTWNQTGYWQNSRALWSHAIDCTAPNAMAHNNLGCYLLEQGKLEEANSEFKEALRIDPEFAEARQNVESIRMRKDHAAKLISYYQKSLQLDAPAPEVQNNLIRLLASVPQNWEPRMSQRPTKLRPTQYSREDNPVLLHTLALAYVRAGQFANATRLVQRAVEIAGRAGRQDLADQWKKELRGYPAQP